MIALQGLHQAGPAQRLGIEALGGQEQDAEIGGVRRGDVFLADRPRLDLQPGLERPRRGLDRDRVGALLGVEHAFVILARELGVDRQPQRLASRRSCRQADRKLDPCTAAGNGLDVGSVLLGGQHLLEQAGELDLAVNAARFHVRQHPVERADVAREHLHLAQALVHLLEPLGHLLEALAQSLLQCGVKLLVDRCTHLVELGLVALLQRREPPLDGLTDLAKATLVGLAQRAELRRLRTAKPLQRLCTAVSLAPQRAVLGLARCLALLHQLCGGLLQRQRELLLQGRELTAEGFDLLVLGPRHLPALGQQALLEQRQRGSEFLPDRARAVLQLGALLSCEAISLLTLAGSERFERQPQRIGPRSVRPAQRQPQQTQGIQNQKPQPPPFDHPRILSGDLALECQHADKSAASSQPTKGAREMPNREPGMMAR